MMKDDADTSGEIDSREMFDEGLMPLQTRAYLYLSGTPFRAISSGEFIEEQIGYPITMVSNGPGRHDIIMRKSALSK